MYNHEPKNYQCPFCKIARGDEEKGDETGPGDIFYRDKFITAWISSRCWPNNDGNVIIIPNKHIENIYDLPDGLSHRIHDFEKRAAIAMKKVYKCDGVSTRQHNEPNGGQDVWHYHQQVFPRWKNDRLYELHLSKKPADRKKRAAYAKKLRRYFDYRPALQFPHLT